MTETFINTTTLFLSLMSLTNQLNVLKSCGDNLNLQMNEEKTKNNGFQKMKHGRIVEKDWK